MSSLGAGMKLGGDDNSNRSSSRGADAADLPSVWLDFQIPLPTEML